MAGEGGYTLRERQSSPSPTHVLAPGYEQLRYKHTLIQKRYAASSEATHGTRLSDMHRFGAGPRHVDAPSCRWLRLPSPKRHKSKPGLTAHTTSQLRYEVWPAKHLAVCGLDTLGGTKKITTMVLGCPTRRHRCSAPADLHCTHVCAHCAQISEALVSMAGCTAPATRRTWSPRNIQMIGRAHV